jgi:hypothetical protein
VQILTQVLPVGGVQRECRHGAVLFFVAHNLLKSFRMERCSSPFPAALT